MLTTLAAEHASDYTFLLPHWLTLPTTTFINSFSFIQNIVWSFFLLTTQWYHMRDELVKLHKVV